MDVPATWRWFELLVTVADELGSPVEMILVDPSVKRHLAAHLPRRALKTALWTRIIRLAGGHDGHHHLRILAADARAETAARRVVVPEDRVPDSVREGHRRRR